MTRCRLCDANDLEALAEDMAREMWASLATNDPHAEWHPWDEASHYWQRVMRQYAEAVIRTLRREHPVHRPLHTG
ncbi:hypothetical protein [Altericroceibacterium xinjiangense]|uniref:hypothetical protein n=1 Tax=Altericroceibacterium xinjiangense TaxID=762261 RepID=UPI000F7F5ABD|nr:hypothetical protein [Altericroceibacterium xinjiangense]